VGGIRTNHLGRISLAFVPEDFQREKPASDGAPRLADRHTAYSLLFVARITTPE